MSAANSRDEPSALPDEPGLPAELSAEPALTAEAGAEPSELTPDAAEAPDDTPDVDAALVVASPGGGARFAGGRSTPPRAAPDDDPVRRAETPERLLLVPLLASISPTDGEPAAAEGERCLLVRLAGVERCSLLAMDGPGVGETLAEAVASVLHARLGLRLAGEPRVAEGRVPARLAQPRRGASGPGWLRAVVVHVEGEPTPGPLVDEVLALPLDEAARALATDAERQVLGLARA